MMVGRKGLTEVRKVAELFQEGKKRWDLGKIGQLYGQAYVDEISRTRTHPEPEQNRVVWEPTLSGQFSVKSVYHELRRTSFCS